jgi:hypothetical protein
VPSLPTAAVNAQLDMLRWIRSAFGGAYCDNLVQPQDPEFTRMMIGVLNRAETYAVTTEIAELLTQASATIPDYPLHDEDLPTPGGFVYFETPQVFGDDFGKPLAIGGLAWYRAAFFPTNGGGAHVAMGGGEATAIALVLFTNPGNEQDHLHHEWVDDPELQRVTASTHGMLSMWGGIWDFGEPPNGRDRSLNAWLMSFFRFVQEPFIEMRMIIPDRSARRRVMRLGSPEPTVRVVQLRHKEPKRNLPSDEPPLNEQVWSHRWLVRGHWRNQWYPSQDRHAPRWIAPFIKGPEDRPLVLHDHVFKVSR